MDSEQNTSAFKATSLKRLCFTENSILAKTKVAQSIVHLLTCNGAGPVWVEGGPWHKPSSPPFPTCLG